MDKVLKDAKNYFCDWIGFKLTESQFMEILSGEAGLKNDILHMGADTCNRESFMGVLARKITGRDWPTGGTSKEDTVAFWRLMEENGPKMGYDVPKNYGENM